MIVVGKIVGCFGIRGYVKVMPATHIPQRLVKLSKVFLGVSDREIELYEVESAEERTSNVVMKFRTVSDRTQAESLIGSFLFVDDNEAIVPSKGSYLIHEIIGCEVWSQERFLGHVEEVYALPAQDIWAIRDGTQLHLIPAVKEFIKRVDIKNKRIDVDIIEGLLE